MRNGKSGRKATKAEKLQTEASGGNVFADLGIANPELALAKAKLVLRIRDIISERELTQTTAARLLNLDQPKVSALVRGKVQGFSLDRLFRLLHALGQDIEISVKPNRGRNKSPSRSVKVNTLF